MGKKYLKTAPLREVTDVKFLWPLGQKSPSKVSIFAASNKKNVAETLQENQTILILLQKYVYTKNIQYDFNVAHGLQHVFYNKTEFDNDFSRKFILIWRKFALIWRKIIIMSTENMDDEIKWIKDI